MKNRFYSWLYRYLYKLRDKRPDTFYRLKSAMIAVEIDYEIIQCWQNKLEEKDEPKVQENLPPV